MASEQLTVRIGANISDFERKMSQMQNKLNGIGRKLQRSGAAMTAGITAPIVGAGAMAVKTGMDFDDAMAKVQAVSGAAGDELQQLREKAKHMGATTKFSASEAAEAMNYMALAGWDTNEMLTGIDGVMNLAAASGEDLGTVSDIVTDSLSAFGLEAKDSAAFADVLAAASANANTDVAGLGAAFQYVAPVAGALGFSVEDTAKAIGLMSDNGIKGEKAGTALRTMMTNLASPTKQMEEAMDELGISLTDSEGNMKSLDEVMLDMRGAFQGLDKDQQAAYASTIFGKEAMSGALAIINTSEESYNNLGDAINNSEGAAKSMAEIMGDTLGGKVREMKSGLEGLAISVYETLLPALEKMADKFLGAIQWANDLSPRVKTLGVIFAGVAAAIGPLLLVGGTLLVWFSSIASTITKLLPMVKGIGGAFSFLTGPVGLVIAGLVALGAGFVLAYKKSETFRNFIDGLREKFANAWQGAMEFKDKVVEAIQGVIAMFRGDWLEGATILKKLGMSDEQVFQVELAVLKVRKFFHDMKEKIGEILGEVKGFFVGEFNKIRAWWDRDGRLILDAIATVFKKVFDDIKKVAQVGLDFVRNLFEIFAPIVKGIWSALWPTLLYLASTAWENIKVVIGTAMDLVRGIISGVSALIEGDWSKFGEVLKSTAGSIKNRVTEYFGNMRDNALRLFDRLTGGGVQKITELKDKAIAKVVEMGAGVAKWFSTMRHNVEHRIGLIKLAVTEGFKLLKEAAINRVTEMYNSVTGWFADLWRSARNKFNEIRDGITSRITKTKDNVVRGVTQLYDRATDIFGDLKESAQNKFDDIVDGAKKLPGRIGRGLSSMASYAVDGAKKLGNKIAGGLEGILNDIIGGLNDLLGAIGIGKGDLIPDVSIPRFSTGTGGGASSGYVRTFSTGTANGRIARDMVGIVNDRGPGNGRGGFTQELIQKRDGSLYAPQGKDVMVNLEQGDRIFNGAEVQSMMSAGMLPRFSKGTGVSGFVKGVGNRVKQGFSTLKDVTSNIWDFITKPKQAFQAVIDKVSPSFKNFSGFGRKMARGVFGKVKEQGLAFIKKMFKENSGALGTGKKASFMSYRMTTPYSPNAPVPGYPRSFNGGRHYGIDYGTPIGTPVHAPMAGKLSQFWNEGGGKVAKLTSGNLHQFFMHMQSVKRAGNVKAGELIGRTGNSGRWTTGPHIHWQAQRNTDVLNRGTIDPRKVLKGYANGGIVRQHQMAQIAESGPEAIIPLSPHKRGRANALYDAVGRSIGRTGDEAMLKELRRANDFNEAIVDAIYETEGGDIVLDGEKVGRKVAKHVKRENDYNTNRMDRFGRGAR